MGDRCKISVIITAFDRSEYVRDAIDSAINQTIDSSIYEIFVIKTFHNSDLDKYSDALGIKNLVFDPTVKYGKRLIDTIKRCNGEIIVFLEDDDVFFPGKLEKIIQVFEEHPQLSYYHNEGTYHNKSLESDNRSKSIEKGLNLATLDQYDLIDLNDFSFNAILNSRIWANVSCMAVSKSVCIEHEALFRAVNQPIDVLLFTVSTLKNYSVYADRDKYTIIRLHDTNDSFLVSSDGNFNSALEKRFLSLQSDNEGIEVMINSLGKRVKLINILLKYQDLRLKVLMGLLTGDSKRITLFKAMFYFAISSLRAAITLDRFIAFNSIYCLVSPERASARYLSRLSIEFIQKSEVN